MRCSNKSYTNNSSWWLVLPEYPILSNLQFCRPLGWHLPHSWKKKQFSCATYPTRSCSSYPATAYLCITSLLRLHHCLILHQWWHLSLQSLCHQQGLLLWCLLLCVIMWFQRTQRKWHFFCTSHVHTGPGFSHVGGDHLEECVYLHEAWPQVQKWAADKKVCDMDCSS